MKANRINIANVQVYREEVHEQAGQKPQVAYYLGWGEDDTLVGDPLTYEELAAMHDVIGRVIEQDKTNA
ncbi:MAG: hypothetical protein NC226_09300 [Bacteroides cellulosilyticus]|nr:hypothetical protein [Bacteroides cellulosilyticus]